MNSRTDVLRVLQSLEIELHREETRKSAERLQELLHPDFKEFGRSGKEYSRAEIVEEFSDASAFPQIEANDFKASLVADGVVLLTYVSAHRSDSGQLHRTTLRSSLWVLLEGNWRLRFHQGTPVEAHS